VAVRSKVERIASRAKRLGDLKGSACAFPVLGTGGLHHRAEPDDRRRRVPGRVL